MSRRLAGVVAGFIILAAWTGTAQTQTRASEPEAPPAAFGAPPPGYEPPPPPSPEYAAQNPTPSSRAVDTMPGFITMDRAGASSMVGIQVGFNKIDDVDVGDAFVMRFNPYGQVMLPNSMVGFYGQLPISRLFNSSLGNGDDGTGIGNFELGAVVLPTRSSDLILRAGLALATASDSGLDLLANIGSPYERLTDFVLVLPEYTTFRMSASTVQDMGAAFFRVDGGFDLALDRPDGEDDDPSAFFRANFAAGVHVPGVDLAFELVNLGALNGEVTGLSNRFIHTATLGARSQGEDQFYGGVIFPLDEAARGDAWVLSAGYVRAFR